MLGKGKSLFGGPAVPLGCLGIVLRHAPAFVVQVTEIILSDGVPILSQRAKKPDRGRVVPSFTSRNRLLERSGHCCATALARNTLRKIVRATFFIVGYSYGYFAARDLVRMGACLTVVEFLVLLTGPILLATDRP